MAEISGDQKKSLHVLAYMLFRMGQEDRARKIYAALASLAAAGRPDRHALTGLAAIAIERGEGAEALEYLRAAMDGAALSSKKAALFLMKAQALWLEGRTAEAQAARDEFLFLTEQNSRG
ncbi:MAG: hypothetical protein IJB29_01330 [Mailhella sp.]|nr:hypothetical protein [Mailhella sp.]